MAHRKHNLTAGSSLIEVLVAITILGLVIVPIGSSLVLSFRLNARSEEIIQAQLAVSSAVETMMAGGVKLKANGALDDYPGDFSAVEITIGSKAEDESAYPVTVKSRAVDFVEVTTYIRPASTSAPAPVQTDAGGGTE